LTVQVPLDDLVGFYLVAEERHPDLTPKTRAVQPACHPVQNFL
jgi:hypothetical protein